MDGYEDALHRWNRIRRRTRASLQQAMGVSAPREAILGAHRLLARIPGRLITATLDDALAVEERRNRRVGRRQATMIRTPRRRARTSTSRNCSPSDPGAKM
jgi:hypothetical protein